MKEALPISFIENFSKRSLFTVLIFSVDCKKISKSSTYSARMVCSDLLRNAQESELIGLNPMVASWLFAFMFHSRPDCFNPYKGRNSFKTLPSDWWAGWPLGSIYPSGVFIYIVSLRSPLRYALGTSICSIS